MVIIIDKGDLSVGLIILFWLIFQSFFLLIIEQISSYIPFNLYYSLTIIILSPLALIISFLTYKLVSSRKDVFVQTLFGTTTIFHIILLLYLPSSVKNFTEVIQNKTKSAIESEIPEKEKNAFLKQLKIISQYTVNLLYANVELVSAANWSKLTDFWQLYIKDLSDNKLTDKEIKDLMKKMKEDFSEVTDENKKD